MIDMVLEIKDLNYDKFEDFRPQNYSSRPVALPSLGATKARLPSFPMIKQTAAYKKPATRPAFFI